MTFTNKVMMFLLFDHRGQGYSQRIIPQKGHLDEFRFYTDDMAKIIEKTTALYAYQAQYILAHSLGAFDFHLFIWPITIIRLKRPCFLHLSLAFL